MSVVDVNVRRDVLLCGVVLPASVLTACLCYWKTWLYLAGLNASEVERCVALLPCST